MCITERGWDGCHSGLLSYLKGVVFGECRGGSPGLERTAALPCRRSVPPGRSFDPSASSKVALDLDKGLGLAAVVHLDVDLRVRVALVSQALQVAAVAQQVDGQAESQHAHCQEAHVHLEVSVFGNKVNYTNRMFSEINTFF